MISKKDINIRIKKCKLKLFKIKKNTQNISMSKKLTTEKFIDVAKKIHSSKRYDYSNTVYLGGNKSINIICPKHGEVTLLNAQCHIYSCGKRDPIGCPKCGVEKRNMNLVSRNKNRILTKREFVEKAIKIHGNVYNYEVSDYLDTQNTVDIFCNKCQKNLYYVLVVIFMENILQDVQFVKNLMENVIYVVY